MLTFISILSIIGIIFLYFKTRQFSFLSMLFYIVILLFITTSILPMIFGSFTSNESGIINSIESNIANIQVEENGDSKLYQADISKFQLAREGDKVTLKVTNPGIMKQAALALDNLDNPSLQTHPESVEVKSLDVNIFVKGYRLFTEK